MSFLAWLNPTRSIEADDTPAPRPNVTIGIHHTAPYGWCCDLHNAGSPRHNTWCRTRDASRFPLAGPRQPLITDPGSRWAHLNQGGRRG